MPELSEPPPGENRGQNARRGGRVSGTFFSSSTERGSRASAPSRLSRSKSRRRSRDFSLSLFLSSQTQITSPRSPQCLPTRPCSSSFSRLPAPRYGWIGMRGDGSRRAGEEGCQIAVEISCRFEMPPSSPPLSKRFPTLQGLSLYASAEITSSSCCSAGGLVQCCTGLSRTSPGSEPSVAGFVRKRRPSISNSFLLHSFQNTAQALAQTGLNVAQIVAAKNASLNALLARKNGSVAFMRKCVFLRRERERERERERNILFFFFSSSTMHSPSSQQQALFFFRSLTTSSLSLLSPSPIQHKTGTPRSTCRT